MDDLRPTAEELQAYWAKTGLYGPEAWRLIQKKKLLAAIREATTVDDLKTVLLVMISAD